MIGQLISIIFVFLVASASIAGMFIKVADSERHLLGSLLAASVLACAIATGAAVAILVIAQ